MALARHARLGRYTYYQLRDYLFARGLPTVLITLLLAWISVVPMRRLIDLNTATVPPGMIARYGSIEAAKLATVQAVSSGFLRNTIGAVIFLGALLAMNGIVANDRKLGYYRFLFSKPMTPARYYGQAFGLHSAGFLLLLSALLLAYGAYITPVLTPRFFAGVGIVFLFYASITFALSATTQWDWLSLVAVTAGASVLWKKFGDSTSPLAKLLYLLPPVHRTDEVFAAVSGVTALPSRTLAWIGGYGVLCFVAGLVVLRYRRLAIN